MRERTIFIVQNKDMQTLTETKLTEIFVETDDFLIELHRLAIEYGFPEDVWHSEFSRSEIITLLIAYHLSGRKCLKYFYCQDILGHYRDYFPKAPSYPRFVALIPHVVLELYLLLKLRCQPPLEANYIDSKPLKVCHIKREHQHKVFTGLAAKGKSSLGWFYGFKIHAIIRRDGQLVNVELSAGNIADNNHALLTRLLKGLQGKVYGDKGYLSKLKAQLLEQGLDLIAKIRHNTNKKLPVLSQDAYYLRHRGLIETVFGQCVSLCDIEHTRHRSPINFLCNTFSALLAYTFLDSHPAIIAFDRRNRCLQAA